MKSFLQIICQILIVSSLMSCSGGGGEGGRTRDTAVRLIHAAVALAPLELRVGEQSLQKASYAQPTEYVPVEKGPHSIVLQRANTVGSSFRTIPVNFADETEYSVFLYGGANSSTDGVKVVAEQVEQPEEGFARIRLFNGLESPQAVSLTALGLDSPIAANFGEVSSFVTIPRGPQVFVASVGNSEFARLSIEVPDRGEVVLVASGSTSLGFSRLKAYQDLD